MSSHNLKYLQHLTAEQAALTAVGITDCNSINAAAKIYTPEAIEQAKQIRTALLGSVPLAKQKLAEKKYELTPLWVCAEDEGKGAKGLEALRQIKDSKVKLTRQSLAQWFAAAGNYVEACRIDLQSAMKSKSFPESIIAKASRKAESLDAEGMEKTLMEGTECMKIICEIYKEFYADLEDEDEQPKKEVLLATIKERYPLLSDKEANAIYLVTRKNKRL